MHNLLSSAISSHVDGYKREVDKYASYCNELLQSIEYVVYENRYLDEYSMRVHCYDCHKPIGIDVRTVIRNRALKHTDILCTEHKSLNAKYYKNSLFLKHKNQVLSVFKTAIMKDSFESLPNYFKNMV